MGHMILLPGAHERSFVAVFMQLPPIHAASMSVRWRHAGGDGSCVFDYPDSCAEPLVRGKLVSCRIRRRTVSLERNSRRSQCDRRAREHYDSSKEVLCVHPTLRPHEDPRCSPGPTSQAHNTTKYAKEEWTRRLF